MSKCHVHFTNVFAFSQPRPVQMMNTTRLRQYALAHTRIDFSPRGRRTNRSSCIHRYYTFRCSIYGVSVGAMSQIYWGRFSLKAPLLPPPCYVLTMYMQVACYFVLLQPSLAGSDPGREKECSQILN